MKRLLCAALTLAALVLGVATIGGPASAAPGVARWHHAAGRFPRVMVEDHTGHRFPVAEAVDRWGSGLRLGHCRDGAGCVRIYTRADGPIPRAGFETERPTHSLIELNRYYMRRGAGYRLQVTMHELGHALGLPHDDRGGVMAPGVDGTLTHVSTYERAELRNLYRRAVTAPDPNAAGPSPILHLG